MNGVVCVATAINAVAVVLLFVITVLQLRRFSESVAATTRYNLSADAQALNRLLIEYPEIHMALTKLDVYKGLDPSEKLRADTVVEVWLLHYETVLESWPTMSSETQRLYENAMRDGIRRYPVLRQVLHEDAFSGKPVWHVRLRDMAS